MADVPTPPTSCTLVGVNMEDPTSAVRDPQLAALVRDGWQVAAHVPAQRAGRNEGLLLLALVAVQVATLGLLALYNLGG